MTNIFNGVNSVPYTAPAEVSKRPEIQVRDVVSSNPVGSDSVEISGNKKVKKGPIKALKGFIGNVKKFFASASEYVKGGFKGIVTGAALGSVIYTAGSIINKVRNKNGKGHIILASLAGIGSIAANLWTASLNSTEKQSQIEHRWTGHNK